MAISRFLITALFLVGSFLRLYHFPDRLIFGPEQGMSFLTSAANLTQFSLLGETNWMRQTSVGHIPYHGAAYSYFLLPLLLIFNYQVLPVTLTFVLLNLATALALFVVSFKLFGKAIATLCLFFFLFSAVMIHHSLFAWIVNPTPLLAVLSLWFSATLFRKRIDLWSPFWLGALSGLGFGMQNLYLPFILTLFIFAFIVSKRKILCGTVFLTGLLVGSLPTVIFDLRHDFYHLRTFWQFFLDVLAGQASGSASYYNYLYFYPFIFLFLAYVSFLLSKVYRPLVLVIPVFYIFLNFSSPKFNLNESVGMPPRLTLGSLESVSAIIAADNPPLRYNIATLWDFDTRAHTLRYLLTYYHHRPPQAVEEYTQIDALYALAPISYNLVEPHVYELESFQPYQIEVLPTNLQGYQLYKLTK